MIDFGNIVVDVIVDWAKVYVCLLAIIVGLIWLSRGGK